MAPTGGPLPGWGPPPLPPGRHGATGTSARPVARFGVGSLIGAGIAGTVGGVVLAFVGIFVVNLVLGRTALHPAVGTYGALPEAASGLEVGDCLSSRPSLAAVTTDDEVVPCKERHRAEVIGLVDLPALGARPSDGDLDLFVSEACALAYRDHLGVDPEDPAAYDFGGVVPDRKAWDAGERQVWCLVDPLSNDGDGIGSLARTDR